MITHASQITLEGNILATTKEEYVKCMSLITASERTDCITGFVGTPMLFFRTKTGAVTDIPEHCFNCTIEPTQAKDFIAANTLCHA